MHSVARSLGVSPMALYRHIDDKDALLDGLVEMLLTEIPAVAGTWEERLTALANGIRATARRHPAAFPLVLTRPAVTPAARAVRDAAHAALRDALGVGVLPAGDVAPAERLISTAVLGFAASEAAGRFRDHDAEVLDADFAELLRWLRLALENG